MAKGNWERRAERAAIQREEAKERKSKKKSNKTPNIEAIITFLLKNKYETSNDRIKVWVEDLTSSHISCSSWLRSGDCEVKRCQFSHEYTFFGINNIQPPKRGGEHNGNNNNDIVRNEPILDLKLLSQIPSEKYPLVRFIAINDVCVYDWLHPNVWLEWSTTRTQEIKSRKTLQSVHEEGEEEDHHDNGNDNEDEEEVEEGSPDRRHENEDYEGNDNNNNNDNEINNEINHENEGESKVDRKMSSNEMSTSLQQSTANSSFLQLPQSLTSRIFQFCSLSDICSLNICSQFFRHLIRKDSSIRLRKKEFLDNHSKEINKKKKDDKKKKNKNAYVKKQDKKDGFARGGNC